MEGQTKRVPSRASDELACQKKKIMRRVQKKVISTQNFMGNPILGVSGPYDEPLKNAPQKTAKNGHFWVFLTSKLYFMRSERFQNGAGKCSICYCAPVKKSEKNSKN